MRLIRTLLILLGILAATGVAALLLFAFSAVQATPLVQPLASARQEDVARLKALLINNDPRRLRDGETRSFSLSARDINVGLQAGMPGGPGQRARVSMTPGCGTLDYTLTLPGNPLGEYLNLSLDIGQRTGQPVLERLRLGDLAVPGWSLRPLLAVAVKLAETALPELAAARQSLLAIDFTRDRASLTYRWDRALAKRIEARGREALLPATDRERLVAYYRVLAGTSFRSPPQASLGELLQALFSEAKSRSADGEEAAENRALLLVLGTVLNRSSVHRLVGGDPRALWPGHRYIRWTLHGRTDLAQHFAVSAAIAAAGGGLLADSIGVFKELDDSRGGSGFSFADLLADRAGVELAAAGTGSRARRIQLTLAAPDLREEDFMPAPGALPEGLMELEFRRRYRDLDDARYASVKREIDNRIAAVDLHRGTVGQ